VKKSNGKLYWYGLSADALVETDASGSNPTEYIFFGGKRIARRDPGGAVYYFFADHLGSARIVTNATGTIVEESDYYPFGGERVVVNNDPNPYKFTGKERDTESNLDYFGARYYASTLGRFTSVDPLARSASPGLPQTWNRYTYTLNNPLKYVDPNGKCSAPAGIKSGQVGICIGLFISAKRIGGVGLGDNRGPVANDPKATFKAQVQLVVDPSKGSIESAKTEAGKSSVFVEGLGRKGTASSEISTPTVDEKGSTSFAVTTTATNGLSFLPGAPKESIDITIQLTVTPDGKVGVEGGSRDGYPSLEVFSYDSKGNVKPILFIPEKKPDDLKPPKEQEIPKKEPK
jgi:RHS repeat-associated protein